MCKKVGVWSSYLQMGVGINTGSLHEFGVNMKGVKDQKKICTTNEGQKIKLLNKTEKHVSCDVVI